MRCPGFFARGDIPKKGLTCLDHRALLREPQEEISGADQPEVDDMSIAEQSASRIIRWLPGLYSRIPNSVTEDVDSELTRSACIDVSGW